MTPSRALTSFVVLLLFSLFSLFPAFTILAISFRPTQALFSDPFVLWQTSSSFKNYSDLFTSTDFLRWLFNSIFISLTVTLFGLTLAACGGYALSRGRFAGRRAILFSLLTSQMFPATMLLLPFTILLSQLKLMDSFLGLFVIYSATSLPFCLWQMKAYFDTIPIELEEAARIDGCHTLRILFNILLPLAKPALVITGLFNFLTAWAEYAVAAIILQNPELYTLPLGLKSFQASLSTQWGLFAAASILVSLPVVFVFIALSRYLISGLTMGSVKG